MMSPDTAPVTICVCTFRRPHIARTLASLDAMRRPAGREVRVVVVDNDAAPTAEPLVTGFAAASSATENALPVRYLHRAGGNISLARNACLDATETDLVAFIDDDERVDPEWLATLLSRMDETGADVVLGPVRALHAPDAPAWMRRADVHATRPVFVAGEIRTGYTCNVLMNVAAPSLAGRRFSLARGRSGGEDTAFFDAAWKRGARFAFAPDAWVEEDVPAERARMGWLATRRYRSGQTHGGLLAAERGPAARLAALATAGAKVAYSAASALLVAPAAHRRNVALLRATLHAGTVSGLLGLRAVEVYGDGASGNDGVPTSNEAPVTGGST